MYSLNNIRKTIGVHIELIVFMLIVAFIIYTRPTIFITFSKTLLGKLLMLIILVGASIYNKAYGILIAVLIIAFAEHSLITEGFEDNSTNEMKCPEGFSGPNANGHCTKSWSADCDESCAKDLCSKAGIKWIPLDYATNPYTCEITKPSSMCSATTGSNDGFINFPYEYIEQPTNQNTDVVATNPKAQYLKIKTQTNVYGPGGSAQFRVHTPAYMPSQGDTVQITINEYTGNYGTTGGPIAMINAGKWFNKDGEIPVLIYNTGGGSMNGQLTLSLLILKGKSA